MTINKSEFIVELDKKLGGKFSKKDLLLLVNSYHEVLKEELAKGHSVQFIGFGKFEVRDRAARKGRNPQTGEVINIEASKVPAFKAGKEFKDAIK